MFASVLFITMPKIFKKTCLKSMLCLFWGCCAFFVFLILGIGKSFKIKRLQVFRAWSGLNSQKIWKGGGKMGGGLASVWKMPARARAQKMQRVKKEGAKSKSESGNWSLLLYYIFIFIFILINSLVQIITPAYYIYYLFVQFFTLDFLLLF